jgi:hypothetical protein
MARARRALGARSTLADALRDALRRPRLEAVRPRAALPTSPCRRSALRAPGRPSSSPTSRGPALLLL